MFLQRILEMKSSSHPLYSSFRDLPDPRVEKHSSRHLLMDIMFLAITGVICGAESWVGIERFGHSKKEWLKEFLELPNGIPSHDTIGDLFSRLDPEALQSCFLNWVKSQFKLSKGEVIAIDGKTIRHSYDTAKARPAIHMINAWACQTGLALGQLKTESKSNEITAIPELLSVLDLKGHVVTIDAMGCQKAIAKKISEKGADYVLNLKANHPELYNDVSLFIKNHVSRGDAKEKGFDHFELIDAGHGRIEIRRYWVTEQIDWLTQKQDWKALKSIGMVEYETIDKRSGKVTLEQRFFLSSLKSDAERFAEVVRLHWRIENSLHWCLDVAFREDDSRVRKDNAPENLAILRQIAINLIKQEKSANVGINNKRLMAGWDNAYLAKILFY